MNNFIEGQQVLLELGQKQNEILMTGVKERVGDWPAAQAVTDLLRRSVETFIDMQQEFLKIAGKQTHTWLAAPRLESRIRAKIWSSWHVRGWRNLCMPRSNSWT